MAVQYRKSLTSLSPAEVASLRRGFAKLYTYPPDDNRGYAFIAGMHGHPQFLCPHHDPTFLVWHRAYLRVFERALQQAADDPQLMLPYFDWTAPRVRGLPRVVTAATYSVEGESVQNPLTRFEVPFDDHGVTRRQPAITAWLTQAAASANAAVAEPTFDGFQSTLENGHDGFHGWVGGDMGQVTWAAFDPVFWFHHANIDRLWAEWQRTHANAFLPTSITDAVLRGFRARGRDVLDTKRLDYDYARSQSTGRPPVGAAPVQGPLRVRVAAPEPGAEQAVLVLRDVRPPIDTLEIRVYVNPAARSATPSTRPNGARFVFGHGTCTGLDVGHCDWKARDADDLLGPHHLAPFDTEVDLSGSLAKLTSTRKRASGEEATVELALVFVNGDGAVLPSDALEFSEVTLLTR